MVEYEFQVLTFGRDAGRSDIRRALTEQAEYGRWELHRTKIFIGGRTKTWLRRRIIRPVERASSSGAVVAGREFRM